MSLPHFFETPAEFREWLEQHHADEKELLVGFRRRASKMPSMTWEESVDEALCFGWIDGLRKSYDETSYTIRFTPRKPASTWSAINLRRVEELIALGRMMPAGMAAWEKRHQSKRLGYTYADFERQLGEEEEAEFKKTPAAWEYFSAQAPSYRRIASYWVMSPKRAETRERRLRALIEDSAAGRRLAGTTKYSGKGPR